MLPLTFGELQLHQEITPIENEIIDFIQNNKKEECSNFIKNIVFILI